MIGLLPAEIRRQVGRRGSFYGSMGFALVFAIALGIWAATTSSDPSSSTIINNGSGLLQFAAIISAVIIGAIAGAYDTDQGTMRYLVLTGRPRWQLVVVRYLGMIGTILLFTLPAMLLVLLASVIFGGNTPTPEGDPSGGTAFFDLFYKVWLGAILYGILALSIGTFLKSNAVAIAVSIVLNFAGVLAAGLLWEFVSHKAGDVFFPIVAGAATERAAQTAGPETNLSSYSLTAQLIILGIWIVGLVGVAIWRVERSEY